MKEWKMASRRKTQYKGKQNSNRCRDDNKMHKNKTEMKSKTSSWWRCQTLKLYFLTSIE